MTRYLLFLLRCIALALLIVVASLSVAAAEEVDPTNHPPSDRSGGFSVGRLGLFSGEYGYTHLGEKYAFGDTAGQDVLTLPQRRYLHAYCVRLDESIVPAGTCDAHAMTEEQLELLESRDRLESYIQAGGYALKLFNFSVEQSSDCLTCTFMSNFLIGLTNFSYAVNAYFIVAFEALAPILVAIWIGWKACSLFFNGGDDGRTFIAATVKKMALFSVVWLALVVGNDTETLDTGDRWVQELDVQIPNPRWAWDTAGPGFLSYAFGLASEVRDATIKRRSHLNGNDFLGASEYDAFRCVGVGEGVRQYTSDQSILKFATSASELSCSTERTHMIGISSAMAVLGSASAQFSIWDGGAIGASVIKVISGFFLLFVFGLSAIWFTFLILDVAVRGLITAAFIPVIATMYLFEITRGFANNAFRAMGGALVSAVAIAIVSTLSFYLLTRTVLVYNGALPAVRAFYGDDVIMTPIETASAIDGFREFIVRIQQSDATMPQIPMDFSAPWFYYMILCSLALFTLGKKIIAMLEGMIGHQGASVMADSAMNMARQGITLAQQNVIVQQLSKTSSKFGNTNFRDMNPFGGGGKKNTGKKSFENMTLSEFAAMLNKS